jgi:nitrite reductase (NADH) small subunit
MSSVARAECAVQLRVCQVDELPVGMGRAFVVAGRSIAIFRTRAGSVHAVENLCPHRGGPLADGIVVGDRIVCPLHAHRFNLATGHCDDLSVCAVQQFPVQVHQGYVLLTVAAQPAN